jgi:hypothetical protein
MAGPRYPLEALRKLRDERTDAQVQAVAGQVARCRAAELTLEAALAARRAHGEETGQSLEQERQRLLTGRLSGAELARAAEFEAAARAQAELLERAEARAGQVLLEARAEEHRLREELSRREADAKLVRNHENSFRERLADQVERAEEEATLEQWNARRR